MFCKKCGAHISDDSVFCSACGAKQDFVTQPDTPVEKSQPTHTWICPSCGRSISSSPCPFCEDGTKPITPGTNVCPSCGNRQYTADKCIACGADIHPRTTPAPQHDPEDELPLRYFNFLIYFHLFAGAISDFITGVFYLCISSGNAYDEIYKMTFSNVDPSWVAFFGIIILAEGAFLLLLRSRLAHRIIGADTLYCVGKGIMLVVNAIFSLAIMGASDINVLTILSVGVIHAMECVYLKKRTDIFVNE